MQTSRLRALLKNVSELNTKLIIVTGLPNSGKTAFLRGVASDLNSHVIYAGFELARSLVRIPRSERPLNVTSILREVAFSTSANDILFLDNLEILFDVSLHIDPLGQLKVLARQRPVVAVWPGELAHDRLIYAELGHPEYRSYPIDGLVPFPVKPH
jgi:AAA+ ATPase superfamily predicted ATPase